MTAGSGIVHSEMPEQEDGLMWGFQLWVNLPAKDKMTAPRYQDIAPERIPEVAFDGSRVRVIAGQFHGVDGPVQAVATQPLYLDIAAEPNAAFETRLPQDHNAFAYVFEGSVRFGPDADRTEVRRGELAVLESGDAVVARAGNEGGRCILVAGRRLREPVARHGPIVMNTHAELVRAFEDLQSGSFT
jgi:quercetin 2,3-dioxygenase